MPVYTYRREDGTTFELRQSFTDDALKIDPETGQKVSRVVHNAGVIFKGSGFYKNDHRDSSKSSLAGSSAPKESSETKTEAAKPAETAATTPAASSTTPAPAAD